MGPERSGEDTAEHLFGAAVGRAVVVGQVETGDAAVEGGLDDRTADFRVGAAAEIVPEAQGYLGQQDAAAAAAAVIHRFVAGFGQIVILHRDKCSEKKVENISKKFGSFKKVVYLCSPFPRGREKIIENTGR